MCVLYTTVQEVLKMMVDLEEESDWSVADEVEEEDNDRYESMCL